MFENIKNGWAIASQTRKAIFKDKELFVYPILSAIVAIIEAIVIFAGLFITVGAGNPIIWLVGLFLLYLVSAFTSTYFLMALMIAFRSFQNGKKLGLGEAMGQVSSYTGLILQWAIFTAVVLMILRIIESRLQGIGRILVSAIGGAAISVATLFAVPIILDERTGPIKTIEVSVAFFTKNFGSTFGGILCSDLYGLLFVLLGIVVVISGILAGLYAVNSSGSVPFVGGVITAIAIVAVGFAFILFGAILSALISNIFKLVLYDFQKTGTLPDGFDKELMQKAIKQQKKSVFMGAL
jgi:hypothetical protein